MSGLPRRAWLRGVVGGAVALAQAPAGAALPRSPHRGASQRLRLGLALGSGSARGFAHIGVLKSLVQAGIKPDFVAGSSAGALVGALYAAGYSPFRIEDVALHVRDVEVADFASAGKRGMLLGDSLHRLVGDAVRGATIETLPIGYAAVTTDLRSGERVVLSAGSVADAVRASCSIPGVFVPREIGGRELVDGGLVSPLPVSTARALGGEFVIAVDVGTKPYRTSMPGLYEVLLQSFEIMGHALSQQEAAQADLVIRPDTSAWASSDFSVRREMIQAGYEAAQRALPELKRRLDAGSARSRPT